MSENSRLDANCPAVQTHIEVMQGVIARMGVNSRSCKVWCVTLVAAVLVLVARTGEPKHALIALAPTVLFYLLDAYYLGLERGFRKSYKIFVDKVHQGQVCVTDLYAVSASGSEVRRFLWAMFRSFSVLPFYLVIAVTVLVAWLWIL